MEERETMSAKSPKPRRVRIPKVAYFTWSEDQGCVIFGLPDMSSQEELDTLEKMVLSAVNRALYDFNRGVGR